MSRVLECAYYNCVALLTLVLHDVLYASDIRWNLVSMLVLGLGCYLNFHDSVMELYLGTTYFSYGFY